MTQVGYLDLVVLCSRRRNAIRLYEAAAEFARQVGGKGGTDLVPLGSQPFSSQLTLCEYMHVPSLRRLA